MKPDTLNMIAAERKRQIASEGFDPKRDDEYTEGQLARAAAAYAGAEYKRRLDGRPSPPMIWPWSFRWWKPTPNDRIRELVKAGALIIAEIERLQRAEVRCDSEQEPPR